MTWESAERLRERESCPGRSTKDYWEVLRVFENEYNVALISNPRPPPSSAPQGVRHREGR